MTRPPRPLAVLLGLAALTVGLGVPLLTADPSGGGGGGGGLFGPSGLRPAAATPGRPCRPAWGPAVEIGRIPGQRREVSGFVSSPRHPGVAWMVRDSGNPAVLYSFELGTGELAPGGDGRIRSRAFPVPGAANGDWEDIAWSEGPDGRGRLWISDNVNRHTAPKVLWELAEPDPDRDSEARVLATYRWAYPDAPGGTAHRSAGNFDTETAFFLGGKLTVISKAVPSGVYRFDAPLDPGKLNVPVRVATVPAGAKMTLGSTSADERLLIVSSTGNQTTWVYAAPEGADNDVAGFFRHPPGFTRTMSRSQREAGDFFPHDGCDIILISERQNVWLLRNR